MQLSAPDHSFRALVSRQFIIGMILILASCIVDRLDHLGMLPPEALSLFKFMVLLLMASGLLIAASVGQRAAAAAFLAGCIEFMLMTSPF